jgi:hypothetical protein
MDVANKHPGEIKLRRRVSEWLFSQSRRADPPRNPASANSFMTVYGDLS